MSAPPLAVAGALRDWLLTQPLEGFEESLKMSRGCMLENRFLGGIAAAGLPLARLREVCARLGMPATLMARLAAGFDGADSVHFGFEDGRDGAIFKVYFEYWKRLDAARAAGDESFILHVALKWDARHPGSQAVATYRCHPRLGSDAILRRVAGFHVASPGDPAHVLARRLIEEGARRGGEPPMYLEVSEAGNPRASFDLNFHAAAMELAAFEPEVRDLARHYALPEHVFEPAWARIAGKPLGHFAGGTARDGGSFVTLYHDPLA